MASKSLKKVGGTQKLGQDRLITLLDKQGKEIHDQGKILKRIEEFYTELYGSEPSTIIHTDPKEVAEIASWEMEAAATMRYEEWDSNRRRPYKHRSIENRRRYHLEDTD